MGELLLGRRDWAVGSLLVLFMVMQVVDVVVTEILLRSGQAVEVNPLMGAPGIRLYAKPTIALGLCAAILFLLPPRVKMPAALAALAVASLPLLFLGIQALGS